MTFCLGIKVAGGLVAIADTRVVTGNETTSARKLAVYDVEGRSVFLMTSGLRSVRDKAVTYFEGSLAKNGAHFEHLFEVANAYAQHLRQVAEEDREALEASGLNFNLHTLMGGQMAGDGEHKLFLIYPQGNWVEVTEGTPFYIIGAASYGKPVLDRTLTYNDSLRFALKVGCVAFDSTRINAADVGFPLDVAVYDQGSGRLHQHRFEEPDLEEITKGWRDQLRNAVDTLPSAWLHDFFGQIDDTNRQDAIRALRPPG